MDWPKQVIESKRILNDWYDRICQSGHGEISVEISEKSGTIEIQPTPKIRNAKEQEVFRFEKGGV